MKTLKIKTDKKNTKVSAKSVEPVKVKRTRKSKQNVDLSYIKKNIMAVTTQMNMPLSTLAEEIKINAVTIQTTFKNGSIKLQTMMDIARVLNTSVEKLIRLNSTYYQSDTVMDEGVQTPTHFIPIVLEKARAGYLHEFTDKDYSNSLPKVSIPWLKGKNCFGFEIEGDSMNIAPGSIVVASRVEKFSDVKDGQCYIVHTLNGIRYKRIKRDKESFKLISDNQIYPVDSIPLEEVKSIWKSECIISDDCAPKR